MSKTLSRSPAGARHPSGRTLNAPSPDVRAER
jgi:hypothetical protein